MMQSLDWLIIPVLGVGGALGYFLGWVDQRHYAKIIKKRKIQH